MSALYSPRTRGLRVKFAAGAPARRLGNAQAQEVYRIVQEALVNAARHAMQKLLRREATTKQLATMLTRREIETVRMVASGLRNKEIGAKLSITEGTVKLHLHNIYEKLQVKGRTELVLFAKDKGLA